MQPWYNTNPIRLWRFRHKPPVTLTQLARDLAVSRQAIWYWEHGRRVPKADHLDTLAHLSDNAINWKEWDQWLSRRPLL